MFYHFSVSFAHCCYCLLFIINTWTEKFPIICPLEYLINNANLYEWNSWDWLRIKKRFNVIELLFLFWRLHGHLCCDSATYMFAWTILLEHFQTSTCNPIQSVCGKPNTLGLAKSFPWVNGNELLMEANRKWCMNIHRVVFSAWNKRFICFDTHSNISPFAYVWPL